jgi:hypothetical protein
MRPGAVSGAFGWDQKWKGKTMRGIRGALIAMIGFGSLPTFAGEGIFVTGTALQEQGTDVTGVWVNYVTSDGQHRLLGKGSGGVELSDWNSATNSWAGASPVANQSGMTAGSIGTDGYLYSRPNILGSHIYRAAPTGTFQWGSPVEVPIPLGGAGMPWHLGGPCFNGQQLFYYGGDGGTWGDIYASTYNAGTWSAPIKMLGVSTDTSNDGVGWVSTSGLTMLFDSDRPGGYGGFDLYVAIRDSVSSDTWQVSNLGPTVNSAGNERSPIFAPDADRVFFTHDGTFYSVAATPEPATVAVLAFAGVALLVSRKRSM